MRRVRVRVLVPGFVLVLVVANYGVVPPLFVLHVQRFFAKQKATHL